MMDYPTILIKITGVILLLWTLRSVYKHFAETRKKNAARPQNEKKPSLTEQFLNNLLLYLWLAFMLVFSTGMVLNN